MGTPMMLRSEVATMHRLRAEGLKPVEIAPCVGRSARSVRSALRRRLEDVPEALPTREAPDPALSAKTRLGRAELCARLRSGSLTLEEVLLPAPDPLVVSMPLIDVIRMQYRGRSLRVIECLGKQAVRDGVNLLMLSSTANTYSLAWVVQYASKTRS